MNGIEQHAQEFRGNAVHHLRVGTSNHDITPLQTRIEHIGDSLEQLTQRQREILRKVVDGTPNKIIAMDLNISQRTVEKHREGIRQKMGVRSLAELVRSMVLYDTFAPNADGRSIA
jgi:FixJ family two-component response regulator